MMRGVGGPLLCIGDLLSDVAADDDDTVDHRVKIPSSSSLPSSTSPHLRPSDLHLLYQENYNQLNEALTGTDHSWTTLTLKLCSALKTADKLVQTANSNARLLQEKVGVLESIIKRGDSAIKTAKAIQRTQSKKEGPSV